MMAKDTALLIIDMLNDFVLEGAPLRAEGAKGIIVPIREEIEKAKTSQSPVIYLSDRHEEDDIEFRLYPRHAVKNTEGEKVIEELRPQGNDIIVRKYSLSGFYNTVLEKILKKLFIKKLLLTGIYTNICVQYTAFEAVIRGYEAAVVKRATIGTTKKEYNQALEHMKKVLKVNVI
jgi:nicotinamidase/pyrazinamidase